MIGGTKIAGVVAILALAAAPYAIKEIYYVNIASQILLYAIFALGLSVLVGYAGLVSLGHAGLFGVAAYAAAYLLAAGYGHAVAVLAALAIALLATAAFAALSLRATGISFIMITLALGEILWGLAYRWISVTNGDNGINVATRPEPFGLPLVSARGFYGATLVVFLLAVAATAIFVRSPFGAAVCGKGMYRFKGRMVTVETNEATGALEINDMDAHRFRDWVENFLTCYKMLFSKGGAQRVPATMTLRDMLITSFIPKVKLPNTIKSLADFEPDRDPDPLPEFAMEGKVEDARVRNPSQDCFEAAVRGAVDQFEG